MIVCSPTFAAVLIACGYVQRRDFVIDEHLLPSSAKHDAGQGMLMHAFDLWNPGHVESWDC